MAINWPWHFVSVSEAELQQRRELLNLRGYYAQISVAVALVLLRLYCGSSGTSQAGGTANSPRNRQRSWWDSPPVAGWAESRRQYALTLLWLTWLVALSMWKTGDDYLHLTKALGHVALSQLPVQVLMSPAWYLSTSKPASPSVVSVLTTIPQSSLTPYHRLFGRAMITLLAGHATLYLAFFVQSSHPEFGTLLAKRLQDDDVQCGIAAITMIVSVLVFVRPVGNPRWLRLWSGSLRGKREAFYYTHLLLVVLFGLSACYHVVHAQTFVLQALGAFVVNVGCCWVLAK